MQHLLNTLKKDIAITFEGADNRSIKFASAMLTNHGFPAVPPEYTGFLKLSNGLIWNGIELYGTKAEDREGRDYTFPGLVEANMDFMGFDALLGKIIVGRAPEELLVWSKEDERWQCVDRGDFTVAQVAPSFKELFLSFIDGMC